jgi:hypothetical protein
MEHDRVWSGRIDGIMYGSLKLWLICIWVLKYGGVGRKMTLCSAFHTPGSVNELEISKLIDAGIDTTDNTCKVESECKLPKRRCQLG